jgi:hypothetical protein
MTSLIPRGMLHILVQAQKYVCQLLSRKQAAQLALCGYSNTFLNVLSIYTLTKLLFNTMHL